MPSLSGLACFTLVALALTASPAAALKLVPFSATFTPTGAGASQVFHVDNDSDQPIAVQISLVHREMAIDGAETLTQAEDDFAVFPAQIVLLPREGRAVRVQWLGDPAPTSELTYRMVVEQLPVELNQQQPQASRIKVLLRYEATVYVGPPGVSPSLTLDSAGPAGDPGKPPMLALTVRNRGTAHVILHDLALTLRSKLNGTAVTLSGDGVKGMGEENVLPGHVRRFLLPWPAGLPVGDIEGSMKIEKAP